MSLTPLADAATLAIWLGETFDTDDTARADVLLDHASSLIRIAAGQTWTVPGDAPDGIPQLTVRVAARGWPNPSGLASETTGPYGVNYAAMDLTDDERRTIANAVTPGQTFRGLTTISTTRGCLETRNLVDVLPEGEPIDIGREPI